MTKFMSNPEKSSQRHFLCVPYVLEVAPRHVAPASGKLTQHLYGLASDHSTKISKPDSPLQCSDETILKAMFPSCRAPGPGCYAWNPASPHP